MTPGPFRLFAAAVAITCSLALVWAGHVGSSIAVLVLGYLAISGLGRVGDHRAWLARLKTERAGEDFQSFMAALDQPACDPRQVWLVYTAIRSMAGFDAAEIALRPGDDLVRDLRIPEEDLGVALWDGLKWPLGLDDSPAALEANPHSYDARTVAELVAFYSAQPRLPGVGQAWTSAPVPSARNT